jgi:TRAP-type mannitol/chloroaromatic compound transport system permease small subunit
VHALLKVCRRIDALNTRVGQAVSWLVLAAVVVSATNAVVRKSFDISSNAYLEAQWYMFAAVFLLSAGYTLLRQEHVRIDILYGRFSARTRTGIDIFGILAFLMPFCALMLWFSVPFALNSLQSGETSGNAGGLILWPVKMLMPAGFLLLTLQGLSELIKRVAFLQGLIDDSTHKPDLK